MLIKEGDREAGAPSAEGVLSALAGVRGRSPREKNVKNIIFVKQELHGSGREFKLIFMKNVQ